MGTGIESIHSTGSARTAITSSVHGVLAARLTRRILALAGAVAVPAAALLALACPPLASPALASPALASPALASTALASPALASTAQAGTASVAIDSMSPQTARPGDTVTVSGTVTNRTSQTQAGLVVYLMSSAARFTTRDQMDGYLSQSGSPILEAVGNPFAITGSLRPGATTQWHASFEVNNVGITQFGVYPISAQLNDQAGDVLGTDQTLLPFWPGQQAASLQRPLAISWVWPLIDQPHHQVCTTADNAPVNALTNNALAASLSPGGRLSDLLTAGQAHADADLTWVVDPALLADAAAMTRPYRAGSGPGCIGVTAEPASKAAATWLARLQAVTSVQPTVITPYANVDVSALVHHGLETELTRAYTTGRTVADDVLHGSFGPSIALPAGGTADLSVLTNLAASQDINTVVLNSSQLPPASTSVFEPDDAVTSVRAAGTTMTVLLADSVLTNVLQAGGSSPDTPATQFAVSQRFLAETAMIAAEAPDSDRSIVVEPPESWNPAAALADELLSETVNTPWLTPTPLGNLARTADSDRGIARHPLAGSAANPAELSPGYLEAVAATEASLSAYESMLYRPSAAYLQSLNEALTAAESAAWRRGGPGHRPGRRPVGVPGRPDREDHDHHRAPGADGRRLRAGAGIHPERVQPAHPGQAGGRGDQRAGPDLPADHRAHPEAHHGPAQAGGDRAAACQLGAPRLDRGQAEPDHRQRDAAAGADGVLHHLVHQVRPRDLVPDRRRHRRPRADLCLPGRPALAACRSPGRHRK
jgi:hypothetical protein